MQAFPVKLVFSTTTKHDIKNPPISSPFLRWVEWFKSIFCWKHLQMCRWVVTVAMLEKQEHWFLLPNCSHWRDFPGSGGETCFRRMKPPDGCRQPANLITVEKLNACPSMNITGWLSRKVSHCYYLRCQVFIIHNKSGLHIGTRTGKYLYIYTVLNPSCKDAHHLEAGS